MSSGPKEKILPGKRNRHGLPLRGSEGGRYSRRPDRGNGIGLPLRLFRDILEPARSPTGGLGPSLAGRALRIQNVVRILRWVDPGRLAAAYRGKDLEVGFPRSHGVVVGLLRRLHRERERASGRRAMTAARNRCLAC